MPSRSRRDLIYDLLAPPLILTTPFVSFVNYNDYGFAGTEIWLVLGGLIALGLLCGVVITLGGQWARIIVTAGLLTLFVDFQFDWLDKQLAGKDYLMGDKFTVADAYLFTVLRWTSRIDIDLAKWPNLKAYVDRVAARPKVQEALKAEGLVK